MGWDFWSEYKGETFYNPATPVSGKNGSSNPSIFDRDIKMGKDADRSGYEVKIEMYKSWDNFDLGIGLAYQDHADRDSKTYYWDAPYETTRNGISTKKSISGGEYKSIPVYLTGKYMINYWNWSVTPYLKANIGYSFNFNEEDIRINSRLWNTNLSTDVNNGWYWAVGVGMEYNNLTMDVMYGINYADMDWKDPESGTHGSFDNDYERVTLSVGYKFNIW